MNCRLHLCLYAAIALVWAACGEPTTTPGGKPNEEYVYADLYYRYQPADDLYTVEARLTKRDLLGYVDTPYVSPGGVSFMGSDLPQKTGVDGATRYQTTYPASLGAEARFTLTNVQGERVTIERTLMPYDSLIMGPSPHKNYGFTVYPIDPLDTLSEQETLRVYFLPEEGSPKMATLLGPTEPEVGYIFGRSAISDWPFSAGKLTFARSRQSTFSQEGVRGILTEEVYSEPIEDAVVN